MSLTTQQRNLLRLALANDTSVRRAFLVTGSDRPVLPFEYEDRPPSVEHAQEQIEALVARVAPALGRAVGRFGFSAGGPVEIARVAAGGELVYEREAP